MQNVGAALKEIIKGEVFTDTETLENYSTDASVFQVMPKVVVQPTDTEDLQNLVKFINRQKTERIFITPRAAGTDMSGGPLGESIIVDFLKHFNHIQSIGHNRATVQPGTFYRDFEKQTLKHNLLLPCYTSSRELCTVGGMVANNAGGEKSLSYGKAERYVEQLKVVLHDGNEYTIKPLSKIELEKKMAQHDAEGKIYKEVYALLEAHYDTIQAARPDVSKNSAGYYLWDVWDRKTFDLTKLFVGSQGTLGLITEITFKLITPAKHAAMLVIFLNDLDPLAEIVQRVLKHSPESFESYDDHTLSLAIRFLPELTKRITGGGTWSVLKQFLPEIAFFLRHGVPKLVLLAEFTGPSKSSALNAAQAAQESLRDLKLKTVVTNDDIDRKKYWIIRRESFNLLRHHTKNKHTAPFIDDISVKPHYLPQFLPELKAIMEKYDLVYTLAGHVGDGNFHIIPLMDLSDVHQRAIIPKLSKEVFDLVFRYKGSMSGEHNDGLVRTPYLTAMFGKEITSLFAEVKHIFDPNDIFNPGKKVSVSMAYIKSHLLTSNETKITKAS